MLTTYQIPPSLMLLAWTRCAHAALVSTDHLSQYLDNPIRTGFLYVNNPPIRVTFSDYRSGYSG